MQQEEHDRRENDEKLLLQIYKTMLLARILDSKILSVQRQGRIGPYVPCTGEEGAVVPSAFCLRPYDWLFTSYRELGAHLARGLSVDLILAQLFGNSNDLLKGRQMSNSWGSKGLNDVPTAAPIGAYLPVAVGVAMAARQSGKKQAVLTFLGDGATSSSDFHVAMNFAGVFKAPVVFVCRNNGWAISVPFSRQTAAPSVAAKASAYGFEGVSVDGSDACSVYDVVSKALDKARNGGGPTLVEALTYRAGPHSTADDPKRYRKEESSWQEKDPLHRLKILLEAKGVLNEEENSGLSKEYETTISNSISRQEFLSPIPADRLIFEDVYSQIPWNLEEQRNQL